MVGVQGSLQRTSIQREAEHVAMDQSQSSSRPDLEFLPISWLTRASAATIAIAVLLVVFLYRSKPKDHNRMPPGPRPWPIIGNLGILSPHVHQGFQELAKKYGPIFHLRLGSKDAIVVSSPKIAEEILKTHDIAFASRPKTSQFEIMAYGCQTVVSWPYGPSWREDRKVLTLELVTNKRIQQFQNVRKDMVVSTVCSMFEECKDGKSVCLTLELLHFFLNNITLMSMSKSYFGPTSDKSACSEMEESLDIMPRLFGEFNFGDYIPLMQPFDLQGLKKQMRAWAKQNDHLMQQIVDDRRQKLVPDQQKKVMDFLDVLLTRRTGKEEKPLTDTQIKGMLQNVFLGGADTSSNIMLWAMTRLLKHPDVRKKAQDELDAVVGRDRLVEEADIPNLKYLRLFVNEVFRLHPPVPLLVPHESIESREVAGYHIPAQTQVLVNVYGIQRDPKVWERPLEFDPERFLSTRVDIHGQDVGQDFRLLPFGAGRRSCPAKNLALVLINYFLAVFLQACEWSLPPGVGPEDVDLAEAPGILAPKLVPLEAVVTPRLPLDVIQRKSAPDA